MADPGIENPRFRLAAATRRAVSRLARRHPDHLTKGDLRNLRQLADNPQAVIRIGTSWALQRRLDLYWPPLATLLRRYHGLENPPKRS